MLTYDVVDVFAERPFAGNQLAVVHGSEGLTDEQLRLVAAEFNFSETAFPTAVSATSYDVRIFTPRGELPFAGHPTLGTAWALRAAGLLEGSSAVQRCGAGDIELAFEGDLVRLAAAPVSVGEFDRAVALRLVAGLGLAADDLLGTGHVASAGLPFSFLRVSDDAVGRASIFSGPKPTDGFDGTVVYALADGPHGTVTSHARVFIPGEAVPEDPATGSAAAAFGLVLADSGVLPEGGDYVIRQGAEMGRPSVLHGRVAATDGVASRVEVAGGVHRIGSGTMVVPGA
ncbi:PhzF family phenazine biosynthesis protein [Tessaracoccus palaemonis]|uniref:PhzF family phenazine biosynthesis protein n=1 Tax=Tessaracoccus palaemonis TaxID=2829499 RepID=A0ABX8SER6_9ACTN|nr:PhzF family phenazine biosynthesis protein [Tessaracoccus palaemonis]QXT61811.1 PhzF family phenazine biosynthesis protein [Tessaracoccus palaemonis]